MTRKYLFFEFNNFFSDQWLVLYRIFRLHVTCTIKDRKTMNYKFYMQYTSQLFFSPEIDILPVSYSLKSLSSQKEVIYTDCYVQRGFRSADSLN